MAEQWISAEAAYDIIRDARAICERLHEGLIISRAERFCSGEDHENDVEVPKLFWWAKGEAALDQNWKTGDFSTWLEHEMSLRAFGVRFELAGVLAMLPIERRVSVARSLSVAGNGQWISTSNALGLVSNRSGLDRVHSGRELVVQAGLGFLAARAVMAQLSNTQTLEGGWEWQRREWDVASELWLELPAIGDAIINLESGAIIADNCRAVGGRHINLVGVHFLLEPIESSWPQNPTSAVVSSTKQGGGRPPAAFHDDLMSAIFGQIYSGDLKPKAQAEIERAILKWTTDNGHELSESSARTKARKIWTAMINEGNKPLK